ncbi:glycosyltransferase [Patescibacteria group bacterium]|nr:glycosyltransferase [Patescibacteria group bacterium]MDE1946811.1 glycosyltransferase family 2 protein [Patescibacteria group bacterium]MDE2011149.1 glycosyltransferase family 2 protein [Patescibacteria group bacterium]MDE2233058.1 glycosyltransferase family 2 protein [Patescibacteria group bacterium]
MDTNTRKPLVSVIMAAYNAEKYIGEAIESVQAQTYTNWELIIADDAAKDATGRIADEYARKDPRINVIHLSKNSGQAIARNEAVKIARGEYLAVLDADDLCLPERFAKQVAFLDSHPNVSAVGSYAQMIDQNGTPQKIKIKAENNERIHFKLILGTQFIHSAVMMRKDAFNMLGGYDTNYLYAEDYDLWCRYADAGYELANIPEILIRFRSQPGSVSVLASSTQKIQAEHAYQVNERNLKPYLKLTRPQLEDMIAFINGWPMKTGPAFASLKRYKLIVQEYVAKGAHTTEEQWQAILCYKDMRRELVITTLRRMFKSGLTN